MLLISLDFLSFTLAVCGILFLPFSISLPFGAFVYSLLLFAELRWKRITPVTSLMVFIFAALSLFGKEDWLPYSGAFFYFPLAVVSLSLLFVRKPFTLYYSAGKGMPELHYATSWMWAIIYILAGTASLALMPDASFVYAPLLIVAIGITVTLILNLYYFKPSCVREKQFILGKFTFREMDLSPEDMESFYSLAAREVWSTIAQSRAKSIETQASLKETMMNSDHPYEDGIVRFSGYDNGKIIGTIFCVFNGAKGLPIERDTGIGMAGLRHIGEVVEVGHFAIDAGYRFRPDVFLGLFKAVIELAMDKNVSFLANCSFEQSASMYSKIGFTKISDRPIPDTVLGVNTNPSVLNLSNLVVYSEDTDNSAVLQLKPLLNQYLMERYFKRQIFAAAFKRTKPYDFNVKEMFNDLHIG